LEFFGNLKIGVEIADNPAACHLLDFLKKNFRFINIAAPDNGYDIKVKIDLLNGMYTVPEGAELLSQGIMPRVYKNGSFYYIEDDSLFCWFNTEADECFINIDSEFTKISDRRKLDAVSIALFWLMQKFGYHALHANTVINKSSRSILLIGDSGSSKTTTSLNLARQGWNFFSDDIAVLKQNGSDVCVYGFRNYFSLCVEDIDRYGFEIDEFWEENKKVDIELSAVSTHGDLSWVKPDILIFLNKKAGQKTTIDPLNKLEAICSLIETSGGIFISKNKAEEQMNLLKNLINMAKCYRMQKGRDLLQKPEILSDEINKLY